MKKSCLICSEILRGRSDQKFCSDQCRSHYHNHRLRQERRSHYHINARIRKNHLTLSHLFQNGIRHIPKNALSQLDLDLRFITHIEESDGKKVLWVYDIGWYPDPDKASLSLTKATDLKKFGPENI